MLTDRLIDACTELAQNPLGTDVEHAASRAIIDGLACMIAGAAAPELAALEQYVATLGAGKGIVPGRASPPLTPPGLALLAGSYTHALELDDTHSFSSVHGAGPILGAALAAIEDLRLEGQAVDGAALLQAVTVGYEAACRPAAAVRGPDPYVRGFHPTAVYGALGATACALTLFGADAATLRSGLGIAGSTASGLMAYLQNGAWTKKLHAGWAAHAGYVAARLARGGFKGPDRIFDGIYDFLSAHSPFLDTAIFLEELGARPEITRLSFKPWACCRTIHPPITATLAALEASGIDPHEVEAVEVRICDEDLSLVAEPAAQKKDPADPVAAQFSLYWGVAVAVRTGRAGVEQFSESQLGDEATRQLAQRVSYTVDPGLNAYRPRQFPAEATIIDRRGRRASAFVKAPLGDYMNPLSDAELEQKALDLLRLGLGPGGQPALSLLRTLRSAPDVANILRQLVPGALEV